MHMLTSNRPHLVVKRLRRISANTHRSSKSIKETVADAAELIESLTKEKVSLIRTLSNFQRHRNKGMLDKNTAKAAQTIAEEASNGEVTVYRLLMGALRWRRTGEKSPLGAEVIGTYDEGADWRHIAEDLRA